MVKRKLVVRKSNQSRTTRSEQYLINKKYLGDEPIFTKPLTKVQYINALNWYSYMCDTNDAKEYICDYLKNTGRVDDAKRFKRLPDLHVPTTVGWVCRLIQRGCKLPTDTSGYIVERIGEALLKVTDDVEEYDDTPKVSVQDRMREKAHDILGEVEGLIDDHLENNTDFSFYNWLTENNIPAIYVNRIIAKLSPVLDELNEAIKGKDDQLKEGYGHLNKKQLRDMIAFFDGMISDADRYANNTKKARTPRKPRTVSVEKKLKNLKWQKEDATYKIASIPPEKIIGATELWTFNTKYKTITVLKAKDRAGLQVKGTSILNYDEATSKTKGTGRRTEDILQRTLQGGKIILRKLLDELKTDKALAYRINENTILLRVVT